MGVTKVGQNKKMRDGGGIMQKLGKGNKKGNPQQLRYGQLTGSCIVTSSSGNPSVLGTIEDLQILKTPSGL